MSTALMVLAGPGLATAAAPAASGATAVAQAEPAASAPEAERTEAASAGEGVITVIGAREGQVGISYRAAVAGQRALDQARSSLAPQAQFSYRVLRRKPSASGQVTPIRVSVVAGDTEVVVTEDGARPFRFPEDERLLSGEARIVVRGAGAQPVVVYAVQTQPPVEFTWGEQRYAAERLGDVRLLCTFIVAANREMASGLRGLMAKAFGDLSCALPVEGVDPDQQRVWVLDRGRAPLLLRYANDRFLYPNRIDALSHEAVVVVLPKAVELRTAAQSKGTL